MAYGQKYSASFFSDIEDFEYDIQNDYRLDFLRGLGVKVDYIYGDLDRDLGWLHRVMRFLFQESYALQRRFKTHSGSLFSSLANKLGLLSGKTGNLLYKLTRSKFYNSSIRYNTTIKRN